MDYCAAALLSVFEYFHNIRLEWQKKAAASNAVARRHGDEGCQDESLLQPHTREDLSERLLGLYSKNSVMAGLERLEKLGFITVHKNPNPKYSFDQTRYYRFESELVNERLAAESTSSKIGPSSSKIGPSIVQKGTMDRPKLDYTIKGTVRRDISESSESQPLALKVDGPTKETEAESIYAEYPRKVVKKKAIKAILAAMKKHPVKMLRERTVAYAASVKGKEQQYIPHPATWFNEDRFLDEIEVHSMPAAGKPVQAQMEMEIPNEYRHQEKAPPKRTPEEQAKLLREIEEIKANAKKT